MTQRALVVDSDACDLLARFQAALIFALLVCPWRQAWQATDELIAQRGASSFGVDADAGVLDVHWQKRKLDRANADARPSFCCAPFDLLRKKKRPGLDGNASSDRFVVDRVARVTSYE